MSDLSVARAKAGVRAKLSSLGIEVPGLEEIFCELKQPFVGLETQFKQERIFFLYW